MNSKQLTLCSCRVCDKQHFLSCLESLNCCFSLLKQFILPSVISLIKMLCLAMLYPIPTLCKNTQQKKARGRANRPK